MLVIGGGFLAARATLLLAGRGRPRRGPRPAFVLAGPYVRARNPLLGGLLLATVGASLLTASAGVALVAIVAGVSAHLWVVRIEEPRLGRRFGTAYEEYRRHVPRWIPRRGF